MKKRPTRKLTLRKETLTQLEAPLRHVAGGLRADTIIYTVYSTEPYGCEPPTDTCASNCICEA